MITEYALQQEQPPQPAPAPPGGGDLGGFGFFAPLVLMFVVIYFLMIRPSRKQQKDRDQMLAAIKKNDHVLTTGGIYGIVDKVRESDVILKIDERNDVRVRVARSSIVGLDKRAGAAEEAPQPENERAKS